MYWGLARRAGAGRLGYDRGRLRTLRPQQRQLLAPALGPAARRARRLGGAGPALVGGGLDRFHVGIGEAEMMADLMHQHVGHERAEGLLVLGPVVEDRAAVEPDHVRELPGRRGRPALREADAAEEAQKIEGAVEAHLAQRLVVWELLHPHD